MSSTERFTEEASPIRRIAGWAACAVLTAFIAVGLQVSPAHAAGSIVVTPEPSAEGETTVSLSASGFQYVPNAPGGIYVFFGVVSDTASNSWAPSQGGVSGTDYRYASTEGSILLVAFDGGSSAGASNAMIDAEGNWSAELTIPGSTIEVSAGRPAEGEESQGEPIDCLQVTCGVITIGALGNINPHNETFTPVTFAAVEEVVSEPDEPAPDANTSEPPTVEHAPVEAEAEDPGLGGVAIAVIAAALVVLGGAIWAIAAARRRSTGKQSGSEGAGAASDAFDHE